jgi:hypothetical protein
MPRQAKSTDQHLADGTFRASRHADRLELPADPPEPPEGLSEGQRELWLSVCESIPVASLDRWALQTLVDCWERLQIATASYAANPDDKNARVGWSNCVDQFGRFCKAFGMTPASRPSIKKSDATTEESDPVLAMLSKMQRARSGACQN